MARKSQRIRRQKRIERLKAREQEAKMTKVVEDNSAVLERMKSASSSCDKILQKLDSLKTEPEAKPTSPEPQFLATEPPPIFEEIEKEEQKESVDLLKMTKKELLAYAAEVNCNVKRNTTKANIIKAINEAR